MLVGPQLFCSGGARPPHLPPGLCEDLSLVCVFVVSREEGWKERSTSAGLPGWLVDMGGDAGQCWGKGVQPGGGSAGAGGEAEPERAAGLLEDWEGPESSGEETNPTQRKQERWAFKMGGGGLGDWDRHIHASNR